MTRLLVASLLAAGALGEAGLRVAQSPFPSPDEMRLSHEDAVQAAGLMSLGMRRLAADLAFIRLLMYYGGPDERGLEHEGAEEGRGTYPQIFPRALRILDLDPHFSYAAEYASAALAFNLDSPDEALAVLRRALARDPRNWRYRAFAAAIAFHKAGSAEDVRAELAPVADDPEAPTMLKHILAYLDRRLGRREDAIRLYRQILSSRDKGYQQLARQALRELGAPEAP